MPRCGSVATLPSEHHSVSIVDYGELSIRTQCVARYTLDVVTSVPTDHKLVHLRAICLRYPQACEKETWGHPTFRVKDKIFVSVGIDGPDRSVSSATMKSAVDEQQSMLAEGAPYYFPAYVGVKGWIGVNLVDPVDWDVVSELIEESYRLVAPKKLVAELDRD